MAEHNQRALVAAHLVRIVSEMIRSRKKRAAVFSQSLFSDPAWDIVLTLFLAQIRKERITTSEVSNTTSIPLTTVHRWIETLEQKGWAGRTPDPNDQRRLFVELSPRGSTAMCSWLDDWLEGQSSETDDGRVRDLLARIDRDRRGS